jgi:ATP-dependent 26S proteasome regulatory subunit
MSVKLDRFSVSKIPLTEGTIIEASAFHLSAVENEQTVLYNFTPTEDEEDSSYSVRAGAYRVTPKDGLQSISFPEESYFKIDAYEELERLFVKCFKNKIDVFKRANITPKRGILIGSVPGAGKSACIRKFSRELIQSDTNCCILYVDSEAVSTELLVRMFRKATEENTEVKFVVLVIEDIGGTKQVERIDSDLLNFLDGSPGVFNIPTLIIGTTNFLDELADTLTDRPGRFDDKIVLLPPADQYCEQLAQEYSQAIRQKPLTKEEVACITGKELTPAYIREIILRSELYEISIKDAAAKVMEQSKKAKTASHMKKHSSMGFGDYDD